MELSANRRYTSKLVLEDTTIVFQKMKGERAEKNKSIHAFLRKTRSWKIPTEKRCYQGDPEIIEALADLRYHVTRISHPTNVSQASCTTSPSVQFCITGPVSLQVSPQRCLVARELYIAAEELTWPRRARETAGMAGRQIEDSDGILIVPQGTLR